MKKLGSHLILNPDNNQMRVNLEVRMESNMSVNLRLRGPKSPPPKLFTLCSFHKVDRFQIDEKINMVGTRDLICPGLVQILRILPGANLGATMSRQNVKKFFSSHLIGSAAKSDRCLLFLSIKDN